MTTDVQERDEVSHLVEIIKSRDDARIQAAETALVRELGASAADKLMDRAYAEYDHGVNIAEAIEDIDNALASALDQLNTVERELTRLESGNAYHVEYEAGTTDLRVFLDDARRVIRAAQLHHNYLKSI